MKNSLFTQLFKIKHGNRADAYDPMETIPNWGGNFNTLFEELSKRKEFLQWASNFYNRSQNSSVVVQVILNDTLATFEEINRLRFPVLEESIVAQEQLMVVYGIKTCSNLLPRIKTNEDAEKFYKLYCVLWNITEGIYKATRGKCDFWHNYSFRIGLYWLQFVLKSNPDVYNFFSIDDGYGLHLKGVSSSDNLHERLYERNSKGGYHSFNPVYLITMSVTKDKIENHFIFQNFEKEVSEIIKNGRI